MPLPTAARALSPSSAQFHWLDIATAFVPVHRAGCMVQVATVRRCWHRLSPVARRPTAQGASTAWLGEDVPRDYLDRAEEPGQLVFWRRRNRRRRAAVHQRGFGLPDF